MKEKDQAEVQALDTALQQYSNFNSYEDEGDKAKQLKKMMENAQNFTVASLGNKKNTKIINLRKSATPASPHGFDQN